MAFLAPWKASMSQNDDSKNSGGASPDTVMTVQEAGRLGGIKARDTMLAKDPDYYRKIGAKGGKKTSLLGPDHFREIGTRGGNAVKANHGPEHFVAIGKKGAAKIAALVKAGKAAQQ